MAEHNGGDNGRDNGDDNSGGHGRQEMVEASIEAMADVAGKR